MTAPVQVGPSSAHGGPTPIPRAYVTPRERQIVVLVANGTSNKLIGTRLGIAEETVKTYIRSILRKLHADNRAQAAVVALKLQLITLDDVRLPGGLGGRLREDV